MSCNNCGDSGHARHNPPTRTITQTAKTEQEKDAAMVPQLPNVPKELVEARNRVHAMSYDELNAHVRKANALQEQATDNELDKATDAIRRAYIEQLVDVINGDFASSAGMTTEQAVSSLYRLLQRDYFAFIHQIYPNLFPQVQARWEEVQAKRINLSI